jgi:hypothetical protein
MEPIHPSVKYFSERELTALNKKGVGATKGTTTEAMTSAHYKPEDPNRDAI